MFCAVKFAAQLFRQIYRGVSAVCVLEMSVCRDTNELKQAVD